MLLFLGAGASAPFGIPTMPGFIDLLDSKIGSYPIYRDIKLAYKNDYDLEVLMTILEDLSKPQEEIMESISPQTAQRLERINARFSTRTIAGTGHFLTMEKPEICARAILEFVGRKGTD